VSGDQSGHAAQEAYWQELVLCKVVSCYVRRYRDQQARWINYTGIFKAVVTSSTIGAWVIWKDYALVWGILLGITQIIDALKEYIPQTKNRRNASDFVSTLENIIIDARFEWYEVFNGEYDAGAIMGRWRKLAKLLNETETKYFPDGLPADLKRQKLAEKDAAAYFLNIYGVGGTENG
jgi:hypothetical protein